MAKTITVGKAIKCAGKCGACQTPFHADITEGEKRLLIEESNTYLGCCIQCGHWVSISAELIRDLTKSEAEEISYHSSFLLARERVDDYLNQKLMWG